MFWVGGGSVKVKLCDKMSEVVYHALRELSCSLHYSMIIIQASVCFVKKKHKFELLEYLNAFSCMNSVPLVLTLHY